MKRTTESNNFHESKRESQGVLFQFAEVSAVISECPNGEGVECDCEEDDMSCTCKECECEEGDLSCACHDYDYNDYSGTFDPGLELSIYGRRKAKVRDLSGIIFGKDQTLEVYSVPTKIQQMITAFRDDYNKSMGYNVTKSMMRSHHVLVKKAAFPEGAFGNHHDGKENLQQVQKRDLGRQRGPKIGSTKYVETGLFMDYEAYSTYRDYFSKAGHSDPDQRVVDLLLTFINSIQAIYHFKSLGTKVEFSISHMEIHKTRGVFDDHGGDRGPLLTSFCQFQGDLRPDEGKPGHWDIGLLVSGVDFWAADSSGKRSHLTMGLATVTGICTKSYGCVIGEMGVRDRNKKPYPSTGFTSVYVMAHEIGHNLGMSHDSSGNSCPSNGFIMSPRCFLLQFVFETFLLSDFLFHPQPRHKGRVRVVDVQQQPHEEPRPGVPGEQAGQDVDGARAQPVREQPGSAVGRRLAVPAVDVHQRGKDGPRRAQPARNLPQPQVPRAGPERLLQGRPCPRGNPLRIGQGVQRRQVRQEHDQSRGDERGSLVRVDNVCVQVRVHRAEQRLQGEDSDLCEANPGHHRVNLSGPEQGLCGRLFSRLSAGGDENCSELCKDDVHQVLGNRACLEEEDQRLRGADKAQHGQA